MDHSSEETKDPMTAEMLENMRLADARRLAEKVAGNSEFNRRSAPILERYDRLIRAWLIGSIIVPTIVILMYGHEIDRALLGAGALTSILSFVGPALICFTLANEFAVGCVLDEGFRRELNALSQRVLSSPVDRLESRYLWIVHLCRAAALIIPAVTFWIIGGALDDAYGGGPSILIAIGVMAAIWFSVTHLLVKRVLRPRCDRQRAVLRAREDRERAIKNASK